jgi:hypothetical protein
MVKGKFMTEQEFMNSIANDKVDVLGQFLDMLRELSIDYCIIGGLAVNAYVEPVVSLDLDVVIALSDLERLKKAAATLFQIETFPHSINLKSPYSDLRIQLQTDKFYQDKSLICNASLKKVLGYEMKVAALEDVLRGKIQAYSDEERRRSKRQKDLADIFRLVETYPHLKDMLPESVKDLIQ